MSTQTAAVEKIRTGRIATALLLGTVAYTTPFTAGSAVLLPAQIKDIAPDHKVELLAILTATAGLAALLANVVFGSLSDRTRSRYGARTPWIVGGSIVAGVLMVPVAAFDNFVVMLLLWCLAVAALNASTAAVNAILPDRVPVRRRATASAMLGLGLLLGSAIGSVIGAVFVDHAVTGFAVTGLIYVVLSISTVVIAPDRDNRGKAPAPPQSPTGVLRVAFTFPRQAADFYWALFGRLALVLGYFMVNGFQLYILTDYVGLDDDRAAEVVGLNAIFFLVMAIVGVVVAGPLSDRLQRRKPFVIAATGIAILAVVAPLFSATVGAMHVFAVIGGLAFGSYFSVDAALVSEVLPDEESRARDLGILNMANTGGQVLAPGASAALVALGLGFAPVFIGAMAICAVGAALIVPIKSVR